MIRVCTLSCTGCFFSLRASSAAAWAALVSGLEVNLSHGEFPRDRRCSKDRTRTRGRSLAHIASNGEHLPLQACMIKVRPASVSKGVSEC